MQTLQKTASATARQVRLRLSRESRRYAHDAGHHQAGQGESFGKTFYLGLTAIPAIYIVYSMSRSDESAFTRMIRSYSNLQEKWADRNSRHAALVEEAAAQRHLFYEAREGGFGEMKFPEIINTGSPWNVPAGQGHVNIDKLIAKYEKENYEENERKIKAMKEGTLPAQQTPDHPVTRRTH